MKPKTRWFEREAGNRFFEREAIWIWVFSAAPIVIGLLTVLIFWLVRKFSN